MADEDTPQDTPEQAPEQEANPNSQFETQALAALAENDQKAQVVVTQMMDGTLTESQGQAALKAVRDRDAQIGTIFGQSAGGLNQVQGLLAEMGKAGASEATIKKFQGRVNKLYAGKPDAELAGDLVEEIRTGKPAISTPRTKGGKRRSDDELLLDHSTPMAQVREIRARQRVKEGW